MNLATATPRALVPLLVFTAVVPAAPARAAWPTDPAANLAIADRTGEQLRPEVVPTADGGCYVSWFDDAFGGYDLYLQRLDAFGNEQWPHDGVLVADRDFTSTQDYGLAVDTAGNALLSFRDDSGSDTQIVAAKVDPDGNLLWGSPGIQVSSTAVFPGTSRIAGTTDGNVVVAWDQGVDDVVVQKLDPSGAPLWGKDGVTLARPSGTTFTLADLVAADAGTAIVTWVAKPSNRFHIWAQKLAAADGGSLWVAEHVKVFDDPLGSLLVGYLPAVVPDGAGGAVFAWYSGFQCRVQHVLGFGAEAFPHQGVELSTDAGRRISPSVAFDPASGSTYAFWIETNPLQSEFGVYGQRLDTFGTRLWTDHGRVLVPVSPVEITQLRALPAPNGALAAWVETVAVHSHPIRAARVDSAGAFVWSPAIVDVKTAATETADLAAASTLGSAIYAWTDHHVASDVHGQNLNHDGSLGPIVFADGFESGDTSAWSATVP